ncbi:MAG: YfiR family protein [Betaproteobacteria bacterium]|nr:YfiR family protein [Betaproteobacteria bacterium]
MTRAWEPLLLGIVIALMISASGPARSQVAPEDALKVALIYNFALFVEWPQESEHRSDPLFYICLTGEDALGASIAALEHKTIRGRKIGIRRLKGPGLPDTCDLLFVSSSEKRRLAGIAVTLQGKSVLTISDAEGAARDGMIIGLDVANQKMVFDINPHAASRQSLSISSKLLRLSRSVLGK